MHTDNRSVLLFINTSKIIPDEAIERVTDVLSSRNIIIRAFKDAEEKIDQAAPFAAVDYLCDGEIPVDVAFAVVFGGDGSMIRAASRLSSYGVPLVGVNFGAVGYLAELEFCDIPLIERIIDGQYEVDVRMMLDTTVTRKTGETVKTSAALNDVVLSNGPVANLLSFDLFCNGIRLRNFRADGVITATATGSTAYSMSAGGPVLDPSLSAVCVTPICPHDIGTRPVVLNGGSVIELKNIIKKKNSVYLSIDGREVFELFDGDEVRIERSTKITKFIRLKSNDFLGVLKNKLSRGEKHKSNGKDDRL